MDISIVIPTYNNANILKRTLENLLKINNINGISHEYVITDNNSNDDTDKIIALYSNLLPIKACFQQLQGISIAKNTGIVNSSGKLIIFTDDDVRPDLDWLNAYWDAYCKNPEGCFWGGSVFSDFESKPPSEKLLKHAPPSVSGMDMGPTERYINSNEYFIGANWSCTRKALDTFGLFNVDIGLNPSKNVVLVGEETELMNRMRSEGYQGVYLPRAKIHHFVPETKTTLKHISDRCEASCYISELNKLKKTMHHTLSKWAYRSVVENYVKYILLMLVGRDYTEEYIQFKEAKGVIKAAFTHYNLLGKHKN